MEGRVVGARLIGRREELARLDAVRARALSGLPSTVVIGGEAGVGKSRLVAELRADWEATGVRWLAGGCIELGDGGLAFAPIVEALRRLVRATKMDELDRLLGPARAELSRLLPELGVQPPQPTTPEVSLGPGSEQRRLFELLLGLLERLARSGPVALVIEDLHWADRSTLDLLAFLVRNLRHGPVALVATYRSDELHRRHPFRPFLAELGRSGLVDRIELPRFTSAEVAEQLAGILRGAAAGQTADPRIAGDPKFVDEIFARSDGNAFFVEELAAAGSNGDRDALPEGLRDLLLSRVDRLPEATQSALRLAAVGGRRVDQHLLASLADVTDQQLSAALREAVSHSILVPEPDGDVLAFRHALVQEALYADVLPGERSRLHAAFAEALTAGAGGDGRRADRDAAQLASHWLAAHDLPRALPALVEAGLNAESVYAFAEARRHLEHALDLWDRVPDAAERAPIGKLQVLRRAAGAAARSGEVDRAIALVREALRLVGADGAADPVTAGLLHERLGKYLRLAGRDGMQAMREAVRLVPADPPSPARAWVLSALGTVLMLEPRLDEAQRVSEEATSIARAVGDRSTEGHARNTLGCVLVMRGLSGKGLAHLRAALAIAREIDATDHITRAANNLSHSLLDVGQLEEALAVAQDGRRIARERGVDRVDGTFLSTHAVKALYLLGRWDECARTADEALRLGTGPPAVRTCLRLYRMRLWLFRGDLPAAAAELEHARREHGVVRDAQDVALFTEAAAMLALHEGRLEDGLAVAAEGIARVTAVDGFVYAYPLCAVGLELEAARAERLRGHAGRSGTTGSTDHVGDPVEVGDSGLRSPNGNGASPVGRTEPVSPDELEELATLRRSVDGMDEIRRSAQRLTDRLRALPGPRYPAELAHLETGTAELSRVLGLADPEGWTAAVAAWDRAGQPYRAAHARWRAAEALVAAGAARERVEAPLRSAHATATRLEAAPLRVELEQLALRAGIPITARPEPAYHADGGRVPRGSGLTRRELEVLHLLTVGQTNRQIATALSISIKTASVHVSNILAKLAVGSRTEAAALASRHGIATTHAAR